MKSHKPIRSVIFLVFSISILFLIWYLFFHGTSKLPIASSLDAIKAVKTKYHEVSNIEIILTPEPFKSQLIVVHEKEYGWDIIFYKGSGDCPSGCINNYFWYFSVYKDGRVNKAGEYSRVFEPGKNTYKETGSPMWGYPK